VAAVVSAGAYQGPPELTMARAFTSWTLDLPVLAVVLLAAALYLVGAGRMRRAGGGWAPGRTAAFCGGLGLIVIATSPGGKRPPVRRPLPAPRRRLTGPGRLSDRLSSCA
jgi:Cytochrome c oxidase caa3 assembly factor (Caa3_CtaG)